MAASPRTCADVYRVIVEAGCPVGRGTIVKRTGYCPATVSASVQRLHKSGQIAPIGPERGVGSALRVWVAVPVGSAMSPTVRRPILAVPQGHPDAVWSGCLERAGLAPGLSSYAQRGSRV